MVRQEYKEVYKMEDRQNAFDYIDQQAAWDKRKKALVRFFWKKKHEPEQIKRNPKKGHRLSNKTKSSEVLGDITPSQEVVSITPSEEVVSITPSQEVVLITPQEVKVSEVGSLKKPFHVEIVIRLDLSSQKI